MPRTKIQDSLGREHKNNSHTVLVKLFESVSKSSVDANHDGATNQATDETNWLGDLSLGKLGQMFGGEAHNITLADHVHYLAFAIQMNANQIRKRHQNEACLT